MHIVLKFTKTMVEQNWYTNTISLDWNTELYKREFKNDRKILYNFLKSLLLWHTNTGYFNLKNAIQNSVLPSWSPTQNFMSALVPLFFEKKTSELVPLFHTKNLGTIWFHLNERHFVWDKRNNDNTSDSWNIYFHLPENVIEWCLFFMYRKELQVFFKWNVRISQEGQLEMPASKIIVKHFQQVFLKCNFIF